MPQNERTIQEDADPVFAAIHRQTLSRFKTRTVLKDLADQGFVIVKKVDLQMAASAPVRTGLSAAVLAAADKFD